MEAVELSLPAAVEVSKILTVERFGIDGVSIGGAEKREMIAKDPVFGRFPVSRCSTSGTDMPYRVAAAEQNSVMRSKKADAGLCMFHSSLPSYADEPAVPQDDKPLFLGKQLQRKAGKTPKSSSFCSKRPRSEHVQGAMSQTVFSDYNVTGKHKSTVTEDTVGERSPAAGQKHSIEGKRSEKRNFKQPTKTKVDPFFSKAGVVSSLPAGGGNILGLYGLKSDIHDVTKHVDNLSLNDLLDGSCKFPNLCQDKGKKATNTNENLIDTVKKACSILRPWKPVHPQNGADLDSSSSRKIDTCILSSSPSVASGTDSTQGDNNMVDLASSSKDTCLESTTTPLYQPNDLLERLALPPAINLDALLLDTSKPPLSRSMNDVRLSKPMSCGASLPPFPWSHSSSGPSKTNIDAGKLYSNRSRWVRVGSIVNSLGDPSSLIDLSSVNFDHESSVKGSDATSFHSSFEFALQQRCQGSSDWQLKLGLPKEKLPKAEAEHSPRRLAAAQTLCEIFRHTAAENQNSEKLRWPKKPSQKAMKARKRRSTGKTEALSSLPKSILGPSDVEVRDTTLFSKKPKYTHNKKMDISHIVTGKGPIKWSVPTSSRSSPSRPENGEAKHTNGEIVKITMGPSYKRSLDKACDNALRKAVSMDWGRGRSKNEC